MPTLNVMNNGTLCGDGTERFWQGANWLWQYLVQVWMWCSGIRDPVDGQLTGPELKDNYGGERLHVKSRVVLGSRPVY